MTWLVTNKCFEGRGKSKAIREVEDNFKKADLCVNFSRKFCDPNDLENRDRIISAFHQNG